MVSMCAVVEKYLHAICLAVGSLQQPHSYLHALLRCAKFKNQTLWRTGPRMLAAERHCRTLDSDLAVERTVQVCRTLTASTL